MNTIELIQNEIKTLPDTRAKEVLDFVVFLKTRPEVDEWNDLKNAQMESLSDIWDNDEDEVWDNV